MLSQWRLLGPQAVGRRAIWSVLRSRGLASKVWSRGWAAPVFSWGSSVLSTHWTKWLIISIEPNNRSLHSLTEVRTQCERAVIVQLLMTSPLHRIAHSLYLNLSSKFQFFPIGDVLKHELCLPNLAR